MLDGRSVAAPETANNAATFTHFIPMQHPTRPSHPGELIREILAEHLRLPILTAAERMHISRQSHYAVLNGESAVTADMVLRFGKLTGGGPGLYMQMQDQHDLWEAG